jgi:two-component system cell cycle sensor histidine kinase/response regulator CckA
MEVAVSAVLDSSVPDNHTILFVEDEEMLRPLIGEALRSYGYTVLEASSAREAIELAEQHGDGIALLFTDVVMEDMDGVELAERLVAARPGLKVLFTSGYPADTPMLHRLADPRTRYIEKPYRLLELAEAIREHLASGHDGRFTAP